MSIQLTIRPDTQYADVYVDDRVIATAVRRRVTAYSDPALWRIYAADDGRELFALTTPGLLPASTIIKRVVWDCLM